MTKLCFLFLACMVYHARAAAPCDSAQEFFAKFHECKEGHLWDSVTHNPETNANSMNLFLKQACSTGMAAFKTCMTNAFSGCDAKLKDKLSGWYDNYHDTLCDGNNLKPIYDVGKETLFNTIMSPDSCVGKQLEGDSKQVNKTMVYHMIGGCFAMTSGGSGGGGSGGQGQEVNAAMDADISRVKMEDHATKLKWFGKGILNCVRRLMEKKTTCNHQERKMLMAYLRMQYLPMGFEIKPDEIRGDKTPNARATKRTTVRSYGDPHIEPYVNKDKARTDPDATETCGLAGYQMLLENRYLSIYANFTIAKAGVQATYMEDIEVYFYNKFGDVVGEYLGTGEDADFPKAFRGGRKELDMDGKGDLKISQFASKKANKAASNSNGFIKIIHPKSGSFIGLGKRKNKFLSLVVRLSDEQFEDSQGILVWGCLSKLSRAAAGGSRRKRSNCISQCASLSSNKQSQCQYDCNNGDQELAVLLDDMDDLDLEGEADDVLLSGVGTIQASMLMMLMSLVMAKLS